MNSWWERGVFLSMLASSTLACAGVGEVVAVIGATQRITADGAQPLLQGEQIEVGDILQTGKDGRIHLHMIDDALLSVRPDSQIKIARYTYQPADSAATQIRIDLVYGTVRSVTGKGGQVAKDRFRFNTPVAAIGVRGTDFVAQADGSATRVLVASGAIVLAPFGSGCQSNALGPCQTASARVLSADMHNMMLQLMPGMSVPQLVPLTDRTLLLPSDAASIGQGKSVAIRSAETPSANPSAQQNTLTNLARAIPALAAPPVPPVPAPPLPPAPPVHYQLVWGIFGGGTPGSDIAGQYLTAAQGREAIVGWGANGTLFRDLVGPTRIPATGLANFSLRQAQVSLTQGGVPVAGTVQGGQLGINFATATYATQLNLLHPALAGGALLNAAGYVRDDGLLQPSITPGGSVVGTLSRDTREAGYQFSLPTTVGTLNGTTLWVR